MKSENNPQMTLNDPNDIDAMIAGIVDIPADEQKEDASSTKPEVGKKKSGIDEILEWLSN